MKATFTYLFTLLALPLIAQVTIDQNNFPRPSGFTDSFEEASTNGVALPTEGTAQTWDYSSLSSIGNLEREWFSAAGDPYYPNALHFRYQDYTFAGYERTGRTYEAMDADGWYEEGRFLNDTSHSITSVTGGPNDVLSFPEEVQDFEGRINYLNFPVAYGSSWTQQHVEITSFNLTVAAFGLNNTPGTQKRYHTQTRTVVGEGTLIIPDENGNPSAGLDALLIKVEDVSDLDSVFLGGQPAPAALLSAFGTTQGAVTEMNDFYVFYVPDFGSPAMNLNLDANGAISSIYYRPSAANVATGITHMAVADMKVYPNPLAAGDVLNVELPVDKDVATMEIVDVTGRQVYQQPMRNTSARTGVALPSSISEGIYTVVLRDAAANMVSTTRLVVR